MILEIRFEDFKNFVEDNNKRIYYFQEDTKIDLYFLLEGIISKSSIDVRDVENKETFFGDKMFIGATKLLFNLSNKDTSIVKSSRDVGSDIIKESESEENENVDIQKEGVDE